MSRTELLAKRAGAGSVVKVAIATMAVLTLTVSAAAAGVLPFAGGSGPAVTKSAFVHTAVAGDPAAPSTSGRLDVQANGSASAAPSPSVSVAAQAGAGAQPSGGQPATTTRHGGGAPPVARPDLSGLTQLPAQVLRCFAPVIDLVKRVPSVPVAQIIKIGPTVVGCVSAVVQDLPLPAGVHGCISQILAFVSHLTSQPTTGIPTVGDLNLAACIPAGLSVTPGPLAGSADPGPGTAPSDLSGLGQLPAQVLGCLTPVLDLVRSLPTVSLQQISRMAPAIVGCVSGIVQGLPLPAGLGSCISQILAFVSHLTSPLSTGTASLGDLNLAACVPTGVSVPTGR